VSLKIKILILFLLGGLSLHGQSFMYSYVDPCTRETKIIMYDMSTPIVVAYYGQTKAFTYADMQNGIFETWLNGVYSQFSSQPCQGILISTTTTSTTNLTTNIINSVLNLNSITSLSSVGSISTNIGSTTNTGSNTNGNNNNNSNNTNNNSSIPNNTSSNGNTSGSGSSGSNGNGKDGNSGGSTSGGGETQEGETPPTQEEIAEAKTDAQKTSSSNTSKTTSKAKSETQKPAILITGDIVGLQKTEDNSNDARGTFSYTRVKGDGTASLGVSADYMINAKIGNVTLLKSWISTTANGNKGINLLSSGFSLMPGSASNTTMFIRVNSLKKLTLIYGAAGSYGKLFGEELATGLAISGFMYKGKLAKKLDATVIMACVYSPFTKYYTTDWFKSTPIIVPFFNFNYRLTKTFGMGLTGGTTYMAGQNVVNYQVLMGAKLIL
jgi:hypothetical protein